MIYYAELTTRRYRTNCQRCSAGICNDYDLTYRGCTYYSILKGQIQRGGACGCNLTGKSQISLSSRSVQSRAITGITRKYRRCICNSAFR